MIESVAAGISDIIDESDRDGMRVVIELKRGAMASVVLNNLYKHTELQSRFSCNLVSLRHTCASLIVALRQVALVDGRPELLNLKQMLSHFLEFRSSLPAAM